MAANLCDSLMARQAELLCRSCLTEQLNKCSEQNVVYIFPRGSLGSLNAEGHVIRGYLCTEEELMGQSVSDGLLRPWQKYECITLALQGWRDAKQLLIHNSGRAETEDITTVASLLIMRMRAYLT